MKSYLPQKVCVQTDTDMTLLMSDKLDYVHQLAISKHLFLMGQYILRCMNSMEIFFIKHNLCICAVDSFH